jgi:uncharacterized protein
MTSHAMSSEPTKFDAAALPGWQPRTFRQFVIKIHSRCDLACNHCYVYTMADQRWRTRPRVMSHETMDQTAKRIGEHSRAHGLTSIDVIMHGGEPLLAGPDRITHFVSGVRSAVGDEIDVRVSVQTNGTLLNLDYLRLFHDLRISVGISLDGDRIAQDRHRRHADGRSSYPEVIRALRRLGEEQHRTLFSGLLCTIDLRNDPIVTYESLLCFAPPKVDFLLPHGNWFNPPPGRVPKSPKTPYADWLIEIFERWYGAVQQETRIRMFDEIINVLLGGWSGLEGVGLSPVRMVVVETDGAIEQSDSLASTYQGAAATGLHVADNSFDAALQLPGLIARQLGAPGLATQCRACRVQRTCGGGLYPHRYSRERGFDNASVYCPDLYRLITHIRNRIDEDIAALRRVSS